MFTWKISSTDISSSKYWKKYWKRMNQSLFTIKNIQTLVEMFKIKNCMYPAMISDIFLPGNEIITTLCNRMTFFYFIYKRYIMAKLILPTSKNLEQHIFRIETRNFSNNFKEPINYGNLNTVLAGCVKLT